MHRRRARIAGAAVTALLLFAFGSAAGAGTIAGSESSRAWFVQLASPPLAKGGDTKEILAERAAFYAGAADQGLNVTQRYAFDQGFNGLSVNIPGSQAGALSSLPGVKAVYPVVNVAPAADEEGIPSDGEVFGAGVSNPDLAFSTGMVQATAANTAGWTGAGVKVGVIDSGVDYRNPDLGGCSAIGGSCRVSGGYDFVGNDFDSNPDDSTYNPVPQPDPDPLPCDPNLADARAAQPGGGTSDAGHGTHVAGIIGAKAGSEPSAVTGVAPGVTFYAYRVFGCNGSTTSDVMAAAMERAVADHVQVVNMSIGAAFETWPDYPTAQESDSLVDRGVVVVASIGNSGANGLFSGGAPGIGRKVIGVASVNNLAFPANSFDVNSGGTTLNVAYLQLASTMTAPTSGIAGDIVFVGRGCTAASTGTVDDPYLADPNGKVALIKRGLCTFNEKYARAVEAGATAVVIMNDGTSPSRVGLFAGGSVVDKGVPGVTISFTDGQAIQALADPKSLEWTANHVLATDPTAGQISDFSSWGMDAELNLKPDISAPGGNITSTWPITQDNGHNTISGTSMAAPHVAGAVADYLQADPGATPLQVRDALEATSAPFLSSLGVLDSTSRQGAGLVQILRAIQTPVSVDPGKISLGDGSGRTVTLTLTNSGPSAVTYNISRSSALANGPASGTQYPFTFGNFFASIGFSSSASSVTVPAGGTASVSVTIMPPAFPAKTLYGGFVNFTRPGSVTPDLRVPFGGFVGDYQSIVALGNGGCNLPLLAKLGGSSDQIDCGSNPPIKGAIGMPSGGVWLEPKQDPVVLLFHLDHQVRRMTVTLVDAPSGQPLIQGGRNPVIFSDDLLPRNSTPTSFFDVIWDGTTAFTDSGAGKTHRKAAPAGDYKLVVTVTKAKSFTDSRAAQTETWTSPTISLRTSP
jgi:minor extracellular serine protease Vpr